MNTTHYTILTLDAGGTNLVFHALDQNHQTVAAVTLPAPAADLDTLLNRLVEGFETINQQSGNRAAAISFCFPGPADYQRGIIGDLENLPLFRNGVALKAFLEMKFSLPVYINNDGDLFALGEAMSGLLPQVNKQLKSAGNPKQYRNLLGVTLGTGFGAGIVLNGQLLLGDNSAGAEINRMSNPANMNQSVEEILSIRGIQRLYAEKADLSLTTVPQPFDIYRIGTGELAGDSKAALEAWSYFGEILGEALANAITLVDGLIVIGGGLSGAWPLFLPKAVETMNGRFFKPNGQTLPRLEVFAYNLHNADCLNDFLTNDEMMIKVPQSEKMLAYQPVKKIGVGISVLGTSEAVAVGAQAFAKASLGSELGN